MRVDEQVVNVAVVGVGGCCKSPRNVDYRVISVPGLEGE